MLGIKSNRSTIKGVFADKLREEISAIHMGPKTDKQQAVLKTSEESKK